MAVKSLDEVRAYWERRAPTFGAWERVTQTAADSMLQQMQMDTATSVLECASGCGGGSLEIIRASAAKEARVVLTDLADAMVDMTSAAIRQAGLQHTRVKVQRANAQDLHDFREAQFDRYLANLCLHLVPDPDAVLREARRVVCPGGLAGFTIFGSPENSSLFVEQYNALEESGLEPTPVTRSHFSLGSDWRRLQRMFLEAGFDEVRRWPVQCIMELWDGDAVVRTLEKTHPKLQDLIKAAAPETAQKFRQSLSRRYAAILDSGAPIGLECLVVIARASPPADSK